MTRIFSEFAYGEGPRAGCWWPQTYDLPKRPAVSGATRADVAIIGAGFTGLSAALHLAQSGVKVTVLDAHFPGWGASGRNGGFCCLGGSMSSDAGLDRAFGRDGRLEFRAMEHAAVDLVQELITQLGLNVDQHSKGETELAHRPRDMDMLRLRAAQVEENYGVSPSLIEQSDLADHGMAGPFFGAMTTPIGFGLNPMKYLTGLAAVAETAGAEIYHHSPVLRDEIVANGIKLVCENGSVLADHVVVATNGYSSENLPDWLSGRYMPAQSNILVTRPLSDDEIKQQGWHSAQMSFDTRNLLHYFRLMPDRRFLFGMRGGLRSGPKAQARARHRLRRDFETMFPAWKQVETPHQWSGMVCLARHRQPFVGAIPRHPGWWSAMCYHGNGVAMGSLCGKILADLIQGRTPEHYAHAVQRPLPKFPFGRLRRLIMPPIYTALSLGDH